MTRSTRWELPKPVAECQVQGMDGSTISVRRHGNPDGAQIVFSHGNGLAVDAYFPFWSLFTNRFDVIVFDHRNHGKSPVGAKSTHNVAGFMRDSGAVLKALDQNFGRKPRAGVFHSISALAALLHSMENECFAALVLFDPPFCKPGISHYEFDEAALKAAVMTRNRTRSFTSREEYVELLDFSPAYRRTVAGFTDLLAATTLRLSSCGDRYELCCPSEYEAQAYEYASVWGSLVDFKGLACPTKVVGADPTLPYSFLPSMELSDIGQVDYDFLPETTHFLQVEEPGNCMEIVLTFLDDAGFLKTWQ